MIMVIVRWIHNPTGKIIEKKFSSPYLADKYVKNIEKAKYGKIKTIERW
jgi:hypothetical protein